MGSSRGFSLIEFMVAMLLGTILIGGAVSVYLASKRSYVEVEQVAGLSENGRFALQVLKDSLRHTGFFGATKPGDVSPDASLSAVANDCSGIAAAYDLQNHMFAVATTGDPGTAIGCVTDAVTNTDVLVVKHLAPSPIYDEDPDDPNAVPDGDLEFPGLLSATETYVIANSEYGLLLDGADTAPDVREGEEFARGVAWPYRFQVYYVRKDTVPTLARKTLQWDSGAGSMSVETEDLVPGVETFELRFGVDSSGNGDVDTYMDIATTAAAGAWSQVEAIDIYMLVRSPVIDPGYTDTKTYDLGGVSITPSSNADFPVNVRRLLVRSSISLRNPKLVLRGGA